jgi:trehalose-phosphatase
MVAISHVGVESTALDKWMAGRQAASVAKSFAEKYANKVIIAGIDSCQRLSGVALKLLAFERLLDEFPIYRDKVVLVQRCEMRDALVADMQKTSQEIRERVDKIRSAYGNVIDYEESASYSPTYRVGLFHRADILLQTPIREGLNLLPLEYVYVRTKWQIQRSRAYAQLLDTDNAAVVTPTPAHHRFSSSFGSITDAVADAATRDHMTDSHERKVSGLGILASVNTSADQDGGNQFGDAAAKAVTQGMPAYYATLAAPPGALKGRYVRPAVSSVFGTRAAPLTNRGPLQRAASADSSEQGTSDVGAAVTGVDDSDGALSSTKSSLRPLPHHHISTGGSGGTASGSITVPHHSHASSSLRSTVTAGALTMTAGALPHQHSPLTRLAADDDRPAAVSTQPATDRLGQLQHSHAYGASGMSPLASALQSILPTVPIPVDDQPLVAPLPPPARGGCIIISEFSTASHILNSNLIVNPWNIALVCKDIDKALMMPDHERAFRQWRDYQYATRTPSASWSRQVISDVLEMHSLRTGGNSLASAATLFSGPVTGTPAVTPGGLLPLGSLELSRGDSSRSILEGQRSRSVSNAAPMALSSTANGGPSNWPGPMQPPVTPLMTPGWPRGDAGFGQGLHPSGSFVLGEAAAGVSSKHSESATYPISRAMVGGAAGPSGSFAVLNTNIVAAYQNAKRRLIVLDYGGTLISRDSTNRNEFSSDGYSKHIPETVVNSLAKLSNTNSNTVFVVSGLKTSAVEALLFSRLPRLGLAAENGMLVSHGTAARTEPTAAAPLPMTKSMQQSAFRHAATSFAARRWDNLTAEDSQTVAEWHHVRQQAVQIMSEYEWRVNGSVVREYESLVVWDFKNADAEWAQSQAKFVAADLEGLASQNVKVTVRKARVEVSLRAMNKGKLVTELLSKAASQEFDFVLIAGDDTTDEEMFAAATAHFEQHPPAAEAAASASESDWSHATPLAADSHIFTVQVGRADKRSKAKYYAPDVASMQELLKLLAADNTQAGGVAVTAASVGTGGAPMATANAKAVVSVAAAT